ncbi:prepilin-type N-terminal cleavage/methylation domain-containing protein [Luteimonas sp. FXH3W]|uniref:Prepilin-type N-terminal cleavage/methylation domain-containing protein n=1 Tax=Aquilutibacter rugosus TaxID=3115820 RepID=A0ABU7UXX4_9GAMM
MSSRKLLPPRLSRRPSDPEAGFTMIELMVVIAIIALLAMFGVPQYLNQTQRTKLTGALAGAETYKLGVERCIQETGVLTGCNAGTGEIPAAIAAGSNGATVRYVDQLAVANGVITMTSTAKAVDNSNMTLVLTPSSGTVTTNWVMSGTGCAGSSNPRGISCTIN